MLLNFINFQEMCEQPKGARKDLLMLYSMHKIEFWHVLNWIFYKSIKAFSKKLYLSICKGDWMGFGILQILYYIIQLYIEQRNYIQYYVNTWLTHYSDKLWLVGKRSVEMKHSKRKTLIYVYLPTYYPHLID